MDIEGESDGDYDEEMEGSGDAMFEGQHGEWELVEDASDPSDAEDAVVVGRTMAALFPEPPARCANVFALLDDPLLSWTRRKRALSGHPLFLGKMAEAYQFAGHGGCVNTLNYNPTGSLLASGSDDHKVILWREDGSVATVIEPGHIGNVFCAQFRNGSQQIVSCDRVSDKSKCLSVFSQIFSGRACGAEQCRNGRGGASL
jgi:hypothetical protein